MNTIKSKIFTIVISVLVILLVVFAVSSYLYYRNAKSMMIEYASKLVASEAASINKEVIKIEKNARDLALLGELYYKFDRNKSVAEKYVMKAFENYPESLGGGIWFKPYIVNPSDKYDCIYAFRNKEGKVVLDSSFETSEYDYPNKNWYTDILPNVTLSDNIEWSSPYYEKEGSDSLMITAGSGIYNDNRSIVGISTVDWDIRSVVNAISAIKPTPNSFAVFVNPRKDYIIVSTDPHLDNVNLVGKSLSNIPWYKDNLIKITYIDYYNKKYVPYVKILDNKMVLVVCIPKWELFSSILRNVVGLILLLTLISFGLVFSLYTALRRNVILPIEKLIYIAKKISRGDNDIEIKIEKPEEFVELASTYNKMTKDITRITRESEKINSELAIAKSIQTSSLPDVFPPFPERKEFDIYANMVAAKDVGGDFYDFFFIDEDNFLFLIADVSGKGIPAALFMMTVKTLINNISGTVNNPAELIRQINEKICANNKHGFFITLFASIVNVKTGKIYYINCGHNPPLIKRGNSKYEYLDVDSNVPLGIIKDAGFKISEENLNSGDIIMTYTDGVTEAFNSNEDMYGEDRLKNCLNTLQTENVSGIIDFVKSDVMDFTGSIPQSDDITMLVFKYLGSNYSENKKVFNGIADIDNYKKFYNWLHSVSSEWNLSEDMSNKLDMCGEEIYANISFYAYCGKKGYIEATIEKADNELIMTYVDEGFEYNPLVQKDPDITLPPEDRPIGGLGIFMVKQMADNVKYERLENKNVLTLIFKV